jgi:uncharacterized membrane protein YqaE (UPF0057 family)
MYKNFIRLLFMLLAFTMLVPVSYSASLPVPSTIDPDPASVKAAVGSFSNLSKKEKKDRLKEVRKAVKQHKAAQKAGKEPSTNTLLLVILAILLPPLAVYLHQGEINTKFWIALLLTLLFFLPGIIYALVVILGDKA